MAQFYSLDDAAQRLGISQEEFKRRLKLEWTSIRPFRDGATLQFRAVDIDELGRSLGVASDPGLTLGPIGVPPADAESSEEFALTADDLSPKPTKSPDFSFNPTAEDIFSVRSKEKPAKAPSDSDVKLDMVSTTPQDSPSGFGPTEEFDLDLSGPASGVGKKGGSSGKLTAPNIGRGQSPESARIPGPAGAQSADTDSSSEFELSLDADSDSFDLQLTTDSSDEVQIGNFGPSQSGQSGINLANPKDSGLSLESKGVQPTDDSDVDFELSLEPASPVRPTALPKRNTSEDSSSEFELTLDDSSSEDSFVAGALAKPQSEGDIFETDFELPAVDESGSEVAEIDTDLDSDFAVDVNEAQVLADDDSGSEVVTVDEEEVDNLYTADEDADASQALVGARRAVDENDYPVRAITPAPAPWGALPAAVLLPTMLFVFFGALMSFEVMRGMWGYHQPAKPGNAVVRGMADMLGMKVSD